MVFELNVLEHVQGKTRNLEEQHVEYIRFAQRNGEHMCREQVSGLRQVADNSD